MAAVGQRTLSAEPGRKAPYSTDLRWRIVWQRAGMQLPFRAIARNLNISVGTAYNIFRRFEETGDISPKKVDYSERRRLDTREELLILGILWHDCTKYLSEICQSVLTVVGVSVSPSTICRVLRRNGMTRKKVQLVALQRCMQYRSAFMSQALFFKKEMLVWVDETGCDKRDHIRRYGYALRGDRPVYHCLLERGSRVSAIAAISNERVLALELTQGTVDSFKFFDFLRGKLIPEMEMFDGINKHSVLVVDNCAIHHVQEVKDLLKAAGILYMFLPPYSPDLNPAEELFSYIKYYLKDHDLVLQSMSSMFPVIKAAFDSVTAEQCSGWIEHAGY